MSSTSSQQLKVSEYETKRQWSWLVISGDRDEAPRSSSDLTSRGDGGEGDTRGGGFSPAYKHQQQQQHQPKSKGKGATSQNLGFRRKESDPVLCEDPSHKWVPDTRIMRHDLERLDYESWQLFASYCYSYPVCFFKKHSYDLSSPADHELLVESVLNY